MPDSDVETIRDSIPRLREDKLFNRFLHFVVLRTTPVGMTNTQCDFEDCHAAVPWGQARNDVGWAKSN